MRRVVAFAQPRVPRQAPIDLLLEGQADVVIAALERVADGGPA